MRMKIKDKIKLYIFNRQLHSKYPEAQVKLLTCFNPKKIKVGRASYGDISIVAFNNNSQIQIGNYCSIAQNVTLIVDAEHFINKISTYPFKVKLLRSLEFEAGSKGDIVIDDDVWIGYAATIMSGIHIGQGAIIAAGSVVTKDVPPYAIVAGIPAKVIKYRFSVDVIKELVKVDYSKLTKDMVKEHVNVLYSELKDVKQIEWMPKKNKYSC